MKKYLKVVFIIAILAVALTACNSGNDNNGVSEADAVMTQAALLVNEMSTQAAQTEAAKEPTPTNTAVPPTPTNTVAPTATLIPTLPNAADPATATPIATLANQGNSSNTGTTSTGNCTWDAHFEYETIPDGTRIKRETVFDKTWRIKNTGTCLWGPDIELVWLASYYDADVDGSWDSWTDNFNAYDVLETTKASSVIAQDIGTLANQQIGEFKITYQAPMKEGLYRLDYQIRTNGAIIPIDGGVIYVEFESYNPEAE